VGKNSKPFNKIVENEEEMKIAFKILDKDDDGAIIAKILGLIQSTNFSNGIKVAALITLGDQNS